MDSIDCVGELFLVSNGITLVAILAGFSVQFKSDASWSRYLRFFVRGTVSIFGDEVYGGLTRGLR